MRKSVYTLAIVILLSISSNSYALDLSLEREITEISRARCASELKKGQDYETNVLANGNVEFKLLGKKGGALDGTFIYNKREWEEQQKVLIEHQLTRDSNHTTCVIDQVNSLRDTYVAGNISEISGVWQMIANEVANYLFELDIDVSANIITGEMRQIGGVLSKISGTYEGTKITFSRTNDQLASPQLYEGNIFNENGVLIMRGVYSHNGVIERHAKWEARRRFYR